MRHMREWFSSDLIVTQNTLSGGARLYIVQNIYMIPHYALQSLNLLLRIEKLGCGLPCIYKLCPYSVWFTDSRHTGIATDERGYRLWGTSRTIWQSIITRIQETWMVSVSDWVKSVWVIDSTLHLIASLYWAKLDYYIYKSQLTFPVGGWTIQRLASAARQW